MKTQGSYHPESLEYEVIGKTALMRFYENITLVETPETEDTPASSGYEFDRYTLERPHSERLQALVESDVQLWLDYARQIEHDTLAADVRAQRQVLLDETDWTQALDAPISDESREEMREYRQGLRDITETSEFPYIETWPEPPALVKDKPGPDAVAVIAGLLEGFED